MLSESVDGQELLAPLSFSQHSKRLQSARERVSLTQLPGQELPEGDLVQGGGRKVLQASWALGLVLEGGLGGWTGHVGHRDRFSLAAR